MPTIIHLWWEGPFSYTYSKRLEKYSDKGIYQIYGCHPVYGSNVLLYIGMTDKRTFAARLSQQEKIWNEDNFDQIQIYVGRLAGSETPKKSEWSKQIKLAEKLLIFSHAPAYNSRNIDSIPDETLSDVDIYNWDDYRDLMPEISGGRWTEKFANTDSWKNYGE